MATATTHPETTHKMLDRIAQSIKQTIRIQSKLGKQVHEKHESIKQNAQSAKFRHEFVHTGNVSLSRINL